MPIEFDRPGRVEVKSLNNAGRVLAYYKEGLVSTPGFPYEAN